MEESWIKMITVFICIAGISTAILVLLQGYLRGKLDEYKTIEVANPLFPMKLECEISIDYSKASDSCLESIKRYKDLLDKYIDDKGTYLFQKGKELPSGTFVLNQNAVTYYKCTMNPFDSSKNSMQIPFLLAQDQFIRGVFPRSTLAFIRGNDNLKKFDFRNVNLVLKLEDFTYDESSENTFDYRLEFHTKKILITLHINKPIILKNDGTVQSVVKCRNGWMGVGLTNQNAFGLISKPESATLFYGLEFKQRFDLTYREKYFDKWTVKYNSFENNNYFFKSGKDALRQLLEPK